MRQAHAWRHPLPRISGAPRHRCERREWLMLTPEGAWERLPIESVIQRSARKPR